MSRACKTVTRTRTKQFLWVGSTKSWLVLKKYKMILIRRARDSDSTNMTRAHHWLWEQWPNKNTVVSLKFKRLAIQNFELVTPLHEFIKPWVSGVSINMKLISAVWCRCFSFAALVILHDLNHKNAWINHYHYYDRTLTKVGLCIMQTNDSKSLKFSWLEKKFLWLDMNFGFWLNAISDSTNMTRPHYWQEMRCLSILLHCHHHVILLQLQLSQQNS